jgi:transcriptional regulator with XRE-family HTH domain
VTATGTTRRNTQEWLAQLGTDLRHRRIRAELSQEALARRADIGLSALKHLESGSGANLTTLIKVVRALGAEDWLAAFALPAEPSVSPMQMLLAQRRSPTRQRVRRAINR